MIKRLLLMQALTAILLLQSCVSAKIESNKQANYTKQPKKIFLLINSTRETNLFCKSFTNILSVKLKKRGVENTVYIKNPLTLDTEKDINDKINAYAPEALMIFKQTEMHTTNGGFDGAKFEISLIDKDTQTVAWKSVMDIYGTMGIEEATNKAVKTLSEKLAEDKII